MGPLEKGGAQAAVDDSDVPVVGRVIERLTDRTAVEHTNGEERLMLRSADLGRLFDDLELGLRARQLEHARHPPGALDHDQPPAGLASSLLS